MKYLHGSPKPLIVWLTCFAFTLASILVCPSKGLALSIEQETALGKKFLANIKQHFALLDDPFAQEYIDELGNALGKTVIVKPFPFHFYIIKKNDLNAFAGPGGHIFVYSGLIGAMDNVDELAGVLAHEMGHITARHLSQRIEQGEKIGLATMAAVLAGILIGGQVGAALTTGSVAAGIQTQLHYSREDERQADQLGFKYATQAGFEPIGLLNALRIIQRHSWAQADRVPPYLLTHPTGPERIANLESMIQAYHPGIDTGKQAIKLRRLFPVFRTIVRAKCGDPDRMKEVFETELHKGTHCSLAHLGLGIVYKARSEYLEAIRHLRLALEQMPESVPICRELGEAYQLKGDDRLALPLFERILARRPDDRQTMLLLAISYENLEYYDRAIRLLKRLASYEKVSPNVFYHLGLCYGRLNKLALAHYYFGTYFKRLRKYQKARFHFREAKRLATNDRSLQDRIDKASKAVP
ncbi:MAG: M48 family metalloprotease [Deltaproteobacteria bacterium]|nr:M48 family metalloprotease [Deltaproteobacteria bacterium]MBW1928959.1 M48 family metalloprotease [Deltaproteobacteria bacterium]MBW2024502.1 M48 family metalloprotease [Deltaproteobacteria bacterium]MBW2125141.1 M48 family metalloprotease [Deltaproteobacteria bacterium]